MNRYDFEDVDIILTSPPYFNLEIYSDKGSETKYTKYSDWLSKEKLGKMKMPRCCLIDFLI